MSSKAQRPPMRSTIRSTSRATPKRSAIAASGSPSTTTWSGIASAATSVAIGYVAGGTETIRVGAGGIMLPNHSPLVIAEQFGTLADALSRPHRPRPRPRARHRPDYARALCAATRWRRRAFRRTCWSCRRCSGRCSRARWCARCPAPAPNVPLWILGSSLFGAQLAAMLGLPYAFASHFAPDALMPALQIYRETFRPSAAARRALRDGRLQRHRRRHGRRGAPPLHLRAAGLHQHDARHARPPAAADRRHRDLLDAAGEGAGLAHARLLLRRRAGDGAARSSKRFIAETQADELIVAAAIYDHKARVRSYEILAEVREAMEQTAAASGSFDSDTPTRPRIDEREADRHEVPRYFAWRALPLRAGAMPAIWTSRISIGRPARRRCSPRRYWRPLLPHPRRTAATRSSKIALDQHLEERPSSSASATPRRS